MTMADFSTALQLMANGVAASASYVLLGLGISIVYAATKFFNLAYAGVLTWSAYAALVARVSWGWPLGAAVAVAVASAMALGVALEAGIFGPLRRRRRASPLLLLLASLGGLVVLENAAALAFGDASRAFRLGTIQQALRLPWGVRLSEAQLAMILVAYSLVTAMLATFHWSPVGTMIRAVADDAWLARARGLPAEGLVLAATAVGCGLGGVGTVFVAYEANVDPYLSFSTLLKAIVAMIIGGTGTFAGPLVGGLLLGLAEQVGAWLFGAEWQNPIAFGLLYMFLLVRPEGLLGRVRPVSALARAQ